MSAILYAIIGAPRPEKAGSLDDLARAVLHGGAGYVQLRDRESTSAQIFDQACRLARICSDAGVPFIVNDRLDIALASGADGVHLGPDDLPVAAARKLVGPDFIIGASAGTVDRARTLEKAGADYLGVGAIFEARPSKADASAPRGPTIITEIAGSVSIPVIGIGGIHSGNARSVIDAGAKGVAVIRALAGASNPEEQARELCRIIG